MLGLGGDDEDDQRFWNLAVFKIYATDKEIENTSPWVYIILLAIVIGVVTWACW